MPSYSSNSTIDRLIDTAKRLGLRPHAKAADDFAKELDLRAQIIDKLNGRPPRLNNIRMQIHDVAGWQRHRLMVGHDHVADLHTVGEGYARTVDAPVVGMQFSDVNVKPPRPVMSSASGPDGQKYMSGPEVYGRHPSEVARALDHLAQLVPSAGLKLNQTPAEKKLKDFVSEMNVIDGGGRFQVKTETIISPDGEVQQTHELLADGVPVCPIAVSGNEITMGEEGPAYAADDAQSALDHTNAQLGGPSLPTPFSHGMRP